LDPMRAESMGANARKAVRLRMNAESEQRRLLRLYSTILGLEAVGDLESMGKTWK